MAKKRLLAYVRLPTIRWLDREISKGIFASYSHALCLGLKLLRKERILTTKFKKPNFAQNAENAADG